MQFSTTFATLLLLVAYQHHHHGVIAQQAGNLEKEGAPTITLKECTIDNGCSSSEAKLTLDANWRWIHSTNGYENCYTGDSWNSQLCSDPVRCAQNCALEGVTEEEYRDTYGIEQIQDGVRLNFVTDHEYGTNIGSRLYLLDDDDNYKLFYLKNREFSLDIDVSELECGMNGAMYFTEMDQKGGKGLGQNNAGAKYGTGYCDAQCPHDVKFIDGEANVVDWAPNPKDQDGNMGAGKYGACCAELDIWEANKMATAYTPHPCSMEGLKKCDGIECGDNDAGERYDGVCDKDGCDMQPYRMGNEDFYGYGSQYVVDTSKPMTVVTQFLTTDGTDDGDLSEMRRYYIQDGNVIHSPTTKILNDDNTDSITDGFCDSTKDLFDDENDFKELGGMKAMGESLDRGHVMIFSLWDDVDVNMNWLDSTFPLDKPATDPGVKRGECPGGESSTPTFVRDNFPDGYVSFKNAAIGEIGSIHGVFPPSPTPVAPPTLTPVSPPNPVGEPQCGCGSALGKDQPECSTYTENKCKNKIKNKNKCSWTDCAPPTAAPVAPSTPVGEPQCGCGSALGKDQPECSTYTENKCKNKIKNKNKCSWTDCAPQCIQCDDNETGGMKKKNQDCATHKIDNKCNLNNKWTERKNCRLSCYNAGLGYDGDICCNDDTPVARPTLAPVPTPTKPPTKKPTNAPIQNPTNKPTDAPVSAPVSPPTSGGGGITKTGKATFYGGNPNGNACGYNDLPQVTFPKGFSVAIGGDEFNDGYGCGACYEVTCNAAFGNNPNCFCGGSGKNKVIVQATDQCPECGSTHFDLNAEAFTSIVAGQSSGMAGTCGVLETQFRRVSCDFESNIKIRSKSGTSGWWYGLHVDDVAGYGAISKIQLREKERRDNGQSGFDIVCDKSQGASFWICERPNNRQITAPLDVMLTDSSGRVLQNNNVIKNLSGDQEFDFRKNYGPIDDDDDDDNNESPVTTPTKSPISNPTKQPTNAPVSNPTPAPQAPVGNGNGCCSLDYKQCINWCGSSYDSCINCSNNDVAWLPNGPPSNQCVQRWDSCDNNPNSCCAGLSCQWKDNYNACQPDLTPTPAPVRPPPTNAPTNQPTLPPQPTVSPQPTPEPSLLLKTDKAMNAWNVFLGLDSITHKNSPTNYALVASGGAAGGGNLVVSESQAYGLLITGTVLASWDTHAGKVSGSKRSEVLEYFEGYYNFWKQMCKDSSSSVQTNCQPAGNYCKDTTTGTSSVCLPDWRHYKTGGSEATGPAPDADEDAIVGIMLAVKAVEKDSNKPSWYTEARAWADASASAFYDFEVDNSKSDHRLVKLGSCWGGWEKEGNNPSYHSPGSFRVMKDYQQNFPNNLRNGYSAVAQSDWKKLIDTSHEVLRAVQCSNDGALVPNWATIGVGSDGNIEHTGGGFSGSGTSQYEYGAEAARTTFRVALDAAFYPERSNEWSPYLSSFNWRLDGGYRNGSFDSNTFPSCRGPNTNQNISMFGGWLNNQFISGPTYTALITASSDIGNAEAMIDAAGTQMAQSLPGSYYPRSWAMITNLMLSGAMESAGHTLKQ